MTTVDQCMSHDVGAVRADMTLTEAAKLMRHSGVGGIPVLGHDSEECAGILTERDIVLRVLAEERDARAVLVPLDGHLAPQRAARAAVGEADAESDQRRRAGDPHDRPGQQGQSHNRSSSQTDRHY